MSDIRGQKSAGGGEPGRVGPVRTRNGKSAGSEVCGQHGDTMRAMRFVVCLALIFLGACSAPPPEADAESPTAAGRLLALREGVWTNSPRDLALLIEQLESSDPTVRMVALDHLWNLTGEDHGFRYDDPPAQREAAVERWADWLRTRVDRNGGADKDGRAPADA